MLMIWSFGKLAGFAQVAGRVPVQEHAKIKVINSGKDDGVPHEPGSVPDNIQIVV